jgi:hypothetical protein
MGYGFVRIDAAERKVRYVFSVRIKKAFPKKGPDLFLCASQPASPYQLSTHSPKLADAIA